MYCRARASTAGSITRSRLNLAASALNGVPSWKVTSWRSFKVSDLRSSDQAQLSASQGLNSPLSSCRIRFSANRLNQRRSEPSALPNSGSRLAGSRSTMTFSVPPRVMSAAADGPIPTIAAMARPATPA